MSGEHVEFDYKTDHFYGSVWKVDAYEWRGYFEHSVYGDEYGGGLWFEDTELVDYDGIPGYVPKEICDALEKEGFDMSYGRKPEEFNLQKSLNRSVDI